MKNGKQEISRRPLLWLAAALAFTVPPMLGTLTPWVWGCFAVSLAAKFWMDRRGWHLRSLAWKTVLAAAAVGGVQLTYQSLSGLEPSLSLFVLLATLKVFESHTARDFHILALLGWLLCLSGLFISQDLAAGIYATVAFTLILVAVVQFHRGPASRRPFAGPLLAGLGIMLRALPVVVALFFLFPRVGLFHFDLRRSFSGRTGLSNQFKPGSVGNLALSNGVAFRAEFPDGNMPPLASLYWRAAVFTEDYGLTWRYSSIEDVVPPETRHAEANSVRQRIIVEPSGGTWIFALGWPAHAPPGATLYWGNVLRSDRGIYNQWRYEVTSYYANREEELAHEEVQACLQIPPGVSTRMWELARSWKEHSPDARAIVSAAMEYFHQQDFLYTLTPGQYEEKDGLDDFLFRRRSGFCEHYAAAFATLMRLAGVPSRVVVGYHGGQYNALGKYLIVHQSDAHAWCEVWLPGTGWQRVDPTASVAGGEVGSGFVDMKDPVVAGAGTQSSGAWSRQPFLRNIRLAWDAVSYEWDSRLTNFDKETQQSLFLGMGWPDTRPLRLFAWLAAAVACLLGLQALWARWRARQPRDPLKQRYETFCRRLAALGVKREPWEGPAHFADRAAALLPAQAAHIRRVAGLYVSLRYSPASGAEQSARDEREFRRLARVQTIRS